MGATEILFTLSGAWLYTILYRGNDIIALAKTVSQRTPDEKVKVKGGLLRALLVELFLLVPASTSLILILLPLLLEVTPYFESITNAIAKSSKLRYGFYALVGMVSYNFPFAALRQIATRITLNAIREFSALQERREIKLPNGESHIEVEQSLNVKRK